MKPVLRRHRTTAEIDITPFTDVILVLLIIFMLATPFLVKQECAQNQGGFDINLPKAKSGSTDTPKAPVVVALLEDGRMVLEGKLSNEGEIEARLDEISKSDRSTTILVQADRMVPHWKVVRILDLASRYGLKGLSIATQKE